MDFISVVIPAFNAERWIERTLRSVSEAIDSECEVIIVNDGSTDGTHDIALRFADEDPRFSVLDIEHVGPCAARKAGFLASQGDYIMFVDSDDLLPVDSISEQRRLLDAYVAKNENEKDRGFTDGRPKIIVCNTVVRVGNSDKLLISGKRRADTGMEYAMGLLTPVLPGFLSGHFFARDLLESIEWDDSPEITHYENFYLLLSMAMKLNEVAPEKRTVLVVPSVVGYYYMRRAGSQSSFMGLSPKGLERVWDHLSALNLPEPQFTIWGLGLLNKVFIERGIPFPSNFPMAVKLRKQAKALGNEIPEDCRQIVKALGSLRKRTHIAQGMARTAGLTSIKPHLSVVMVCRHNVRQIQRTAASVFGMGFRNLEVIIVDLDNSHSERVALNELSIKYARVRIIKAPAGTSFARASLMAFNAAEGHCVTYLRGGDLCCATGLYEAVTRIDYGAYAVLPNFRDYHPLTKLRSKVYSASILRKNEIMRRENNLDARPGENIYEQVICALNDKNFVKKPFLSGTVWLTEFVKANQPDIEVFKNVPFEEMGREYIRHLLRNPITIVSQDANMSPAFEFSNKELLKRMLKMLIQGASLETFERLRINVF